MEILLAIVLIAFAAAFVLAFAMGANDVANSFGTSVGSKVLTLKQAVIIAAIFETLGSVLIGYQVTETVRKGIVDINIYSDKPVELAFGALAALGGACLWLLTATSLRLPVSTTHSIVGSTIGFSLILSGFNGLKFAKLIQIVSSWFISPVLAGMVSALLFATVRHFILRKPDPVIPGLQALPLIYGFAAFINALGVFYEGSALLRLDGLPVWGSFAAATGIAVVLMIFVYLVIVPWQRRKIAEKARRAAEGVGDVLMDEVERTRLNAELNEISEKQKQGSKREGTASPPIRATSVEEPAPDYNSTVNDKNGDAAAVRRILHINGDIEAAKTDVQKNNRDAVVDSNNVIHDAEDAEHRAAEGYDTITALGQTPLRTHSSSLHNNAAHRSGSSTPVGTTTRNGDSAFVLGQSSTSINTSPAGGLTPPLIPSQGGRKSVVLLGPDGQPLRPISRDPSSIFTDFQRPRFDSTSGLLRRLSKRTKKEREERQLPPVDPPRTKLLFAFVQIMTAAFASFAHGGNDVSNAVGPLVTIWGIYQTGSVGAKMQPPIWILLFGGLGISIGLFVLGRKVIQTIGEDLTTSMTPSSGFCIELGTSFTVLLASKIGLPVSTTHCIVGSVIAVGYLRSKHSVDFKLVRNIVMAWLVTLPVTIAFSAGIMFLFTVTVPYFTNPDYYALAAENATASSMPL